ncbi:MAG: hypothetical protein WC602_05445 [archaeon]
MNVTLRGKTKEILESMVAGGYANTQSEAIRLAIINFGKEHLSETELVNMTLDEIERQVKAGKRKVLTPKQALGKYAKYLK